MGVASVVERKRYTALPSASSRIAVSWATTRAISSRSASRATTVATRRSAACSVSRFTRSVTSVNDTTTWPRSAPGSGSTRPVSQRGPSSDGTLKSIARRSPVANASPTARSRRDAASGGSPSSSTPRPMSAPASRSVARTSAAFTNTIRSDASIRAIGSGESSTSARKAALPALSRSSACLRAVMSVASSSTRGGAPAAPLRGTRRRCSHRSPSTVGISSSSWRSSPLCAASRSAVSRGTTTSGGSPASRAVRPSSASAGRPTIASAASLAATWRSSPSSSMTMGSSRPRAVVSIEVIAPSGARGPRIAHPTGECPRASCAERSIGDSGDSRTLVREPRTSRLRASGSGRRCRPGPSGSPA